MGSFPRFAGSGVDRAMETDEEKSLQGFFVEREGFIPSTKAIGKRLKAQEDTPVWIDGRRR